MRGFDRRLRKLEQILTESVMRMACGAAWETDQRALEAAGVSAAVCDELAQVAVQALASACQTFRFPLDDHTLAQFLAHVRHPCEIVFTSATTEEERERFGEEQEALWAAMRPLTTAKTRSLYDAWLKRTAHDI